MRGIVFELIASPVTAFAGMFQDPQNRWFVLYLATSLALAFVVYRRQAGKDPELKQRGFLGFVFPGEIYAHPSARLDYWFYLLNKLCFAALLAGTVALAQVSSTLAYEGVRTVLAEPLFPGRPVIGTVVTTVLHALAFDFGLWGAHYLFHRIPILWELHKVHHSVQVLTPVSAGRVHPLDDLFSYGSSALLGGVAFGLCRGLFGDGALIFQAFQLHVLIFLFYSVGFHLRHSHVWLPYTGWLGHILISPAHHQLHHSSEERHWDRNMGFMFAIWDWMFGTLYVPSKEPETFRLGIGGEEREFNSVAKLYWLPLRNMWRRLRQPARPAQSLATRLGLTNVEAPDDPSPAIATTALASGD